MGGALKLITGGKPKAPKMTPPPVEKPAPMPDEEQIKRAEAIKQSKAVKTGRASTILSDYEESLG